jgi:hypothetical protein
MGSRSSGDDRLDRAASCLSFLPLPSFAQKCGEERVLPTAHGLRGRFCAVEPGTILFAGS